MNKKNETIVSLFTRQAEQIQHAIAIESGDTCLTYKQLNSKSNQLAAYLLAHSTGGSIFCGLCLERGSQMIVAILGILKAGLAYVPFDPAYPSSRLSYMINESKPDFIITDHQTCGLEVLKGSRQLNMDTLSVESYPVENLQTEIRESDAAYVLFTSGSTGKPKGVVMPHDPLCNLIQWQLTRFGDQATARVMQLSTISFDLSFWEIFSTLCSGSTLVICPDPLRTDATGLLEFLAVNKITRTMLPFVSLNFISEAAANFPIESLCLTQAYSTAEQLKITPSIRAFFTKLNNCSLENHYGPTESHIVTYYQLRAGEAEKWPKLPPIGFPISNTEILILDDQLKPVEPGQEGILYIGGACLAEGYLHRPDLTAEKFLQHPFKPGERLYNTGDIAIMNKSNEIDYHGRADKQVKIRGFRIELGEIEIALAGIEGIKNAAVTVFDDEAGNNKLVAYYSGKSGLPVEDIRKQLSAQLPEYMLPSAFIHLDSLPLTPSGKLDKNALPAPFSGRPILKTAWQPPETDLQKSIAGIWESLLAIKGIGIDDNFFDLGGNSLLSIQASNKLIAAGIDLPVVKLYQHPNIRAISAYLNKTGKKTQAELIEERQQKSQNKSKSADIAIIGMAGRFPGASDNATLWKNLCEGRESVHYFTDDEIHFSIPESVKNHPDYIKARGIIEDAATFDAAFFGISPIMAEIMDPQQRKFLEVAWECFENAGCRPDTYPGLTGVFAGVGNNTYYLNNVLKRKDKTEITGDFQAMVLNEKDYIATRTAFMLNLKGPAVSVYTACSTSLTAIAQACINLRSGGCDMALAGGASITSPVNSGYLYNEGGMLSADGHCRPFDAQAAGTTFSDGVGCILLKRLDDAMTDHDYIYAVIKGVGMNNDGSEKASFTAPGIEGQAGAIKLAQLDAGLASKDVSYIETHGTATPIGDPIEIEALGAAYSGLAAQSCYIGSVKSNFGHLTPAAGVAGTIKTAMALKKGIIPPTINYVSPNPAINLEAGPFKINTKTVPFERKTNRLLAGVSSFGVGGTNVHIILQEAPEVIVPDKEKPVNLILLSAPTETALAGMPGRLANFLKENNEINKTSVSYSLIAGRKTFEKRYFATGSSTADLIHTLEGNNGNAGSGNKPVSKPGLVFMFPGQGSQYLDMGKDLYENEEAFRFWFDTCADKLQPLMGKDIRDVIFAGNTPEAEARLRNTFYTQPSLFAIEYSLAQLFISWGIKPDALVGHSIGEFVAACLADVFSLDDALLLVSTRAKLMQDMPGGSMLSVRKPPAELHDYIHEPVCLAAHNSPALSVLSGPAENISTVQAKLELAGIPSSLLHTSHAFHSAMMDPVLTVFRKTVEKIHLSAPRIPFVSTVTGKWITDTQATDIEYWTNHLRVPVQFAAAIHTILSENYFLLETGPRNTLATLARQHPEANPQHITSSLAASASGYTELTEVYKALGKLWIAGFEPDSAQFFKGYNPQKIPLPTYPFAKNRYWIEPPQNALIENPPLMAEQNTDHEIQNIDETPASTESMKTQLIKLLFETLEESSGIEINQADVNVSLFELGFDSLILTQLAITLQKKFDVKITFRQLNENLSTVSKLADYIESEIPVSKSEKLFANTNKTATTSLPTQHATHQTVIQSSTALEEQLRQIKQQLDLVSKSLGVKVPQESRDTKPEQTVSDEVPDVKKPFGAAARIETNIQSGLTLAQQALIDNLSKQYNRKTLKSKEYTQKNRKNLADPRVVTGFRPLTREITYQIVIERSKGCHMWDIDGNEYIDVLSGFGSNMFGNNPDFITRELQEQLKRGCELGPQHALTGEVTKLICEMTGFERAALCNTGSEAVLGALRMARTVTGKSLVVMFTGSYHGINDEVIARGTKKLRTFPAAPGIPAEAVQNMLILDYGTDESLQIIEERLDELAAVLVEPVQSRRPDFRPVDFLKKLRGITEKAGVALIFDEVITGFRAHPRGAQGLFGIKADLATYGKVIGGGMPIGVMAGISKYMDSLDGGYWQFGDDSIPETGVTYFAGTFVRHPLALAAAKASLLFLKSKNGQVQENLNKVTAEMVTAINALCTQNNWPLVAKYFSSLFKIVYTTDIQYGELLFTLLRLKGIHIMDGFPCFITTAHSPKDISQFIQAFKESATEMSNAGFYSQNESSAPVLNSPPVEGARLGRAENGDPAWFIPDPARPGKYLQIK